MIMVTGGRGGKRRCREPSLPVHLALQGDHGASRGLGHGFFGQGDTGQLYAGRLASEDGLDRNGTPFARPTSSDGQSWGNSGTGGGLPGVSNNTCSNAPSLFCPDPTREHGQDSDLCDVFVEMLSPPESPSGNGSFEVNGSFNSVHPRLLKPLYPHAKNTMTVGEHCLRESYHILTIADSRARMRETFAHNSGIFNDIHAFTQYPTTPHEFWNLLGFSPLDESKVLYEVCSHRHGSKSKPGEYCEYVFPSIPHDTRSAHIHPLHVCEVCVCLTCAKDGRVTRRFEASTGGRVKAKAGGCYLGLEPGFSALVTRPDYTADRKAFNGFLETRGTGRARGHRWQESPNAYAMEQQFNCTDPAEREKVTFFGFFWDYVEICDSMYSIGVKLAHPIDLLMRDVGKMQYVFVVAITIGPTKGGHYDAHNKPFFEELIKLQTVGLGSTGHRFILVKIYCDRPAMEVAAGLRGHNSLLGCGFCTGGNLSVGGAPRYLGYNTVNAEKLCIDWTADFSLLQPVKRFTSDEFLQEGVKASQGLPSCHKRAAAILHTVCPHLDPLCSVVYPCMHCGGHGVCGNFIDILFPKSSDTKFLKLSTKVMTYIRRTIPAIWVPNDSQRSREVHTGYRGFMSFHEEVNNVCCILTIVLPLALEDIPEARWYLTALEYLVQSMRWYLFGIAPSHYPFGNNNFALDTFEKKAYFASEAARRYAVTVENEGVLSCMTYNLHSLVHHFREQELRGGALCCDNELFGERFLKYLAALAKGKVQTPNVELTLALNLRKLVFLADLECGLRREGLLTKSYVDQQLVSLNQEVELKHELRAFIMPTNPEFMLWLQTIGVDVGESKLPETAYGVAHAKGLVYTSVNYALENTRASYWVSYIHVLTKEKAYACVRFYVRVGEVAYAVINELTIHGIDEYLAITLSVPDTPKVAIVPVDAFVFKLNVLFLDDGKNMRASEDLHVRIDE